MRATVLADNIANENLHGEWGLSIFIQSGSNRILLDAGASALFLENAEKLSIDIANVDFGVLSHAHYDHADGLRAFFAANQKAKFYLRADAKENCYFKKWFIRKYIGLPRNILFEYRDRFVRVDGDYRLAEGIYLIPHKISGLSEIGRKNNMYVKQQGKWTPDQFAHEQSLVFDTGEGLVVFNSCSHAGVDGIIGEIEQTFPKKKMKAFVGGFHIYNQPEAKVRALAKRLKTTGVEKIYTGHCTGAKPFAILKEELGERVDQLRVGIVMEF